MNHMIQFSNQIIIVYVETYFKSNNNTNKLWDAKVDVYSNKQHIWNEFKIFLKNDIERTITLQQNFFKAYRKNKQNINQFVKNYNAKRINMFVELKFEFKFTIVVKFNDFRDELHRKLRCMLLKEKKIFTKIELLDRLKRMKNNQILKKKLKSF